MGAACCDTKGRRCRHWHFGVDIGGTNIKIGLVDDEGRIVARRTIKNDPDEPPQVVVTRVAEAVRKLSAKSAVDTLGVGVAGLVEKGSGVVMFSPNLPLWIKIPVKDTLARLTGMEVFCTNDANAVTLGEWLYGAARGYRDVLGITLGTGVGSGLVINNQPVLGANGFAGELGHTVICFKGPVCPCGNSGCVERYVGAGAVVRRARALLRAQTRRVAVTRNQLTLFGGTGEGLSAIFDLVGFNLNQVTPEVIGRAARRGDKLAQRVIEETARFLGIGIINAVLLIDPEIVVIGGGLSRLGGLLLKEVERTVRSRPYVGERRLKIVLSRLREDAGILGASQLYRFCYTRSQVPETALRHHPQVG